MAETSTVYRILFTEDHPDTRDILRLILQHEGFDVTCADSSAEAIRLAKASQFDLYLLDGCLPDMPGDDLCKELRTFDSKTPVLFYSGRELERDKTRAVAAGAQGYVIKPADPDRLVAEIRRLIMSCPLSTPLPP